MKYSVNKTNYGDFSVIEINKREGRGYSIPYSSKEYTFIYGGINYKFPTSTNETALRLWVKYTDSVKISITQRDVPRYKTLDWFTIGYAK